jgi:tRNA G18 (ribose-2'-O)-methylase SpoU
MVVEHLTSLDSKELAPYRTLRRPMEHFTKGYFVAEGEKVVRRLLASGLETLSILCTPEWFELLSLKPRETNLTVYIGAKDLLETIVGYNLHQGIMAVGRVPQPPPLETFLTNRRESLLLVALDGLVNAENVGVLVRNCAAFGVDGILVGETSSSPYLRRAVRNSMGTVFKLPVYHTLDLASTIRGLREKSIQTIAAHPHESASLENIRLGEKICIVFGSEGTGLSDTVLHACEESAGIPMMNGTDSLNVASASAVFLFEINRRKNPGKN